MNNLPRKAIWLTSIVVTVFLISGFRDHPTAEVPVIAVLQNPQYGDTERFIVRVLFAQTDTGWVPLINRERLDSAEVHGGMQWTITSKGEAIGQVRIEDTLPTERPVAHERFRWNFTRDMRIEITEHQDFPVIKNTDRKFAGMSSVPLYKPLVLVNGPSLRDPEEWTGVSPDSSYVSLLYSLFKQEVDSLHLGVDYYGNDAGYVNYDESDVMMVDGYSNRTGITIIGIRVNPAKGAGFEGSFQDPDWSVHWYVITDPPELLGKWLELVDVGDYNSDGRAELLCWYSAYNEDGYSLFYDDFTRRDDYWWY